MCMSVQEHGDTALHIAARHHNVEIGKILAEHSADVNIQNVRSSIIVLSTLKTTPWAIKTCHFYFYDNFDKCGPISIILSLLDS